MPRLLGVLSRKRVAQAAVFGVLLVCVAALGVPHAVFAQADGLAQVGAASNLSATPLPVIIARLIQIFLGVLGIILVVLIIYGGWVYMTAGGDGDKVKKAKKILTNAVIGALIILASYSITTYILNLLLNAAGIGGSGISSISAAYSEPLSGSLGAGIIDSHYPKRNAIEIPRNTLIMVTFKQPIDPASIIDGYDADAASTNMNLDNVSIYQTNQLTDGTDPADISLTSTDVVVSVTDDHTIFVFDPVELLGSSTEDTNYTVFLGPGLRTEDGDVAFQGAYRDGYEWSFEVSTEVDMTPPTVVGISPSPSEDAYAPNITVSITFSEAMNQVAATGTMSGGSGFRNIEVLDSTGENVDGTFTIGNDYRTVDFTPTDACGQDPCGDTIYCLPRSENPVSVEAHAASVGSEPPAAVLIGALYDGLTDASGNSLDGNDDGVAQGQDDDGSEDPDIADDYDWDFATSANACTDVPGLASISPGIYSEFVGPDSDVQTAFDMPMKVTTLGTGNIQLWPDPWYEFWFSNSSETDEDTNVSVCGTSTHPTVATIDHPTMVSPDDAGWNYYPTITSGVKSAYQICMVPAIGPASGESTGSCNVSADWPYCCNGERSRTACMTQSGEQLPDTGD